MKPKIKKYNLLLCTGIQSKVIGNLISYRELGSNLLSVSNKFFMNNDHLNVITIYNYLQKVFIYF